jgi:hypothetical protein
MSNIDRIFIFDQLEQNETPSLNLATNKPKNYCKLNNFFINKTYDIRQFSQIDRDLGELFFNLGIE